MGARLIDDAGVLFIGAGAMGEPMASCVAAAGYELVLSDVDTERTAALAARLGVGAAERSELRALLPGIRTIILMLPSSAVVETVLEGSGGILEDLEAGTVIIDMSSSSPASTRRLAAAAAALGVRYLDAPVSGGVPKARTGELSIMVGGEADVVESRRALLETMGATVTHVGDHGAGDALKALNNLLSAVGMVAASEVLSIAAGFGIEPRIALDVLNASTGRNQATEVKFGRYILSRAFDSGFAMNLMVKDLKTALELAHDAAIPVPISAGALEEWTAALGARGRSADHTEIAAYVESRAGLELAEPAEEAQDHEREGSNHE